MELRAIDGLGDVTLRRLLSVFGGPEQIFAASRNQLIGAGELTVRQAEAVLRRSHHSANRAIDREIHWLERSNTTLITCADPVFPPALREIPDAPILLYVNGTLADADRAAVAVVGSRLVTDKGRLVTEEISSGLAAAGFTIVSGLARGVDAVAHQAALSVGGRTLAVMGCGIDMTYPPEFGRLRKDIEVNGAVLSELPVGTPPEAHNFPRRNRIISGLCLGVVVTEAAIESGSLITARLAGEQGRGVFAVPGFVKEDNSRGTNGLIKQGATLVESADDVLEELLPQLEEACRSRIVSQCSVRSSDNMLSSLEEEMIYGELSHEPIEVDMLIEKTHLPTAVVSAALLGMELRGLVKQLPGSRIVRL